MFEISKGDHFYDTCQVCGVNKTEHANCNIYSIKVMNMYKQGVELHLCKDCCKELRSLLKFTQLNGVKMVSIEEA